MTIAAAGIVPSVFVTAALLGFVGWLVVHRALEVRRAGLGPQQRLAPWTLHGRLDLDAAVAYARRRMRACSSLDTTELRRILGWCGDYVRRHAVPMNGGGPQDGWFLPPNMFDTFAHLEARCRDEGISIDDECLWEIVMLHEDYVRRT